MKRITLLDDASIVSASGVGYTSGDEISRVDLWRNDVYYDIAIVRPRVTGTIENGTASVSLMSASGHHAATGTTGAVPLGLIVQNSTAHKAAVSQTLGTAIGSWLSMKVTSRADAALSFFPSNGGGPGLWERYFYYYFVNNYDDFAISFDVILMSSGFAGYSISGDGT